MKSIKPRTSRSARRYSSGSVHFLVGIHEKPLSRLGRGDIRSDQRMVRARPGRSRNVWFARYASRLRSSKFTVFCVFVLLLNFLSALFRRHNGTGFHTADCGFPGINRTMCEQAGCTYDKFSKCSKLIALEGGFHNALNLTCPPETSHIRRADCGYPRVSVKECREQGCCYSPIYGCHFPISSHMRLVRSSPNSRAEPLFSIILSCFASDSLYLPDALNSVASQAFDDWELIVIDDGSPNRECITVANNLMRSRLVDPSKVKIFYKENGFISDARNFGIARSVGTLILPLDADDYLSPNFLLETYKAWVANQEQEYAGDQLFFEALGSILVVLVASSEVGSCH